MWRTENETYTFRVTLFYKIGFLVYLLILRDSRERRAMIKMFFSKQRCISVHAQCWLEIQEAVSGGVL